MVVGSQEPNTLVGLIGPRRKALRLSMQKAADIADVHRLTWRTWELGTATPQEFNLPGIDKALRLPKGTAAAALAGQPYVVPEVAAAKPGAASRRKEAYGVIISATRDQLVAMANAYAEAFGEPAGEEFLLRAAEIRRDAAGEGGD